MKTCSQCPTTLGRKNTSGLCQKHIREHMSATRTKKRECACGASITRFAATGKCVRCASRSAPGDTPTMTTHVNGNTAEVSVRTKVEVRSDEDLVKVCGIDTERWEIDHFICNVWEVGAVLGRGKNKSLVKEQLFQVKAWLKRRTAVIDAKAAIADLMAQAKQEWPTLQPRKATPIGDPNLMLEIQIPDLHVGKLAWKEETGDANYDASIAEELHNEAFEALLTRASHYNFGRIVYAFGSDGLHSDTKQGTTTGGTVLDTDSRYHKNYRTLQRSVVHGVQLAASIAPQVDTYAIPGNHDTLSIWHLGNALQLFFDRVKGVTVNNTPRMRQYCEHGQVMLMFTHGNQGKLERYPNLMAADEPEMWGRTRFREAHTGDKHQTKVQEIMGARVRICPALCPADAWHAEKHFLHNQRAAEAFIWHAHDGLLGTVVWTVPKGR